MKEKRHAQAHWLRIQAEEAVKLAESYPGDACQQCAADTIDLTGETFSDPALIKNALEIHRQRHLNEAAQSLIVAELLHREIVKL